MKLTEVALSSIEKLLIHFNITHYTIREDGLVDVDGDIDFFEKSFTKFPIKFGKVSGNFKCWKSYNLTSLEGAPTEVGGNFSCFSCTNLTSLEGAPKSVGGFFYCSGCPNLTSLEGAPTKVGRGFDCSNCYNLTSLEGAPTSVGGYFTVQGCTKLTSLEGAPTEVGGDFDCWSCIKLTSLDHLPKKMNGTLGLKGLSKITNYLVIFKTKGVTKIEHDNKHLERIINKYLPTRDMLNCQDELIEVGLEKYAEIE